MPPDDAWVARLPRACIMPLPEEVRPNAFCHE